ncbi:MAG: stage III sporulation protein AD [Clostridia bacterium]|nr:stage III sporulation protein AD [Clostridia bacterium]
MTELFLKITGLVLVTATTSVLLKGYRPEFSFLTSVCACVTALLLIVNALAPFIDYLDGILKRGNVDAGYFTVVLKALAISYIASFAADTCRDYGQSALALKAELAGKCAIFALSIPLMKSVLETALGFADL